MLLSTKSFRWLIWGTAITFFVVISVSRCTSVKESRAKEYYKAKESRRGKIRKAKDRNKAIRIQQDRQGISRQLWIETEGSPLRREFFLEADHAEISAEVQGKEVETVEVFQRPKGWLQEELYWEIGPLSARVIPRYEIASGGNVVEKWVYEESPSKFVEEEYLHEIIPKQRVRYFDAAQGEWNLTTNVMTAYVVSFCVAIMPGHTPTRWIDPSCMIMEGTSETTTFLLGSGDQSVVSTGTRMKLGSRPESLEAIEGEYAQ